MVPVLEEVKRVSLVKETPSDFLMKRFDNRFKCVEALKDLYVLRWGKPELFVSEIVWDYPFIQAMYWVIYNFGFNPDEEVSADWDELTGEAHYQADKEVFN